MTKEHDSMIDKFVETYYKRCTENENAEYKCRCCTELNVTFLEERRLKGVKITTWREIIRIFVRDSLEEACVSEMEQVHVSSGVLRIFFQFQREAQIFKRSRIKMRGSCNVVENVHIQSCSGTGYWPILVNGPRKRHFSIPQTVTLCSKNILHHGELFLLQHWSQNWDVVGIMLKLIYFLRIKITQMLHSGVIIDLRNLALSLYTDSAEH